MKLKHGWVLLAVAISTGTNAAESAIKNRQAALELRAAIERTGSVVYQGTLSGGAAEKYSLPVSPGFNQKLTELCWAYATLNAVETLWLERHPDAPIEFSRGYLQHTTWNDRLERRISHPNAELSERGTGINAIRLIAERGIVQFKDYADSTSEKGPDTNAILAEIALLPSLSDKIARIGADLDAVYGTLPAATQVGKESMTPLALGRDVLEESATQHWISYAVSNDAHAPGWGADPDPDGRGDYQVLFMPLEQVVQKIHDSLKNGVPVTFSNLAHLVEIYGADYDASGKPIDYLIKDSYPGYFYTADAEAVHSKLLEITTLGAESPQ